MGPDRLDKFIKDKVFDHQTATDTDALWEGILAKQTVEKQPKRRFLWWWFMAGLLLIIGLASYATLFNNEPSNNTISEKTETLNNSNTARSDKNIVIRNNVNTSNTNKEKEVISAEGNKVEVESILAEANKNIEINPTATTSTTQSKEETSKGNKVNTKQDSKSTAKGLTSLIIKSETPKEQLIFKKQDINTNDNESVLNLDKNTGRPNTNNNTIPNHKKHQTKATLADKTSRSIYSRANSPTRLNPFKKESNNNLTTNLALQSLLAQLENDILPALIADEKLPKLLDPPTKPHGKPSPISIGLHFGYGFAKKQLKTNTTNEEASKYLKLREESETPMQVLNGGFDIAYQFRSGLYAKAGLQFEQITERFDYSKTSEIPFFNDTATYALYYTMNGSIEKDIGTESMEVRTQTRKTYNRYRTVDLPLSIGYQPTTKNNFNWFVEGGVLVNLAFSPRGEVLDYNGEDRIDLSSTAYFKKNIGLSLTAGLGLSYRVTKHWSVWMSPKFRLPLMGMTDEGYLLEQRFLRGVVEVGGRVRF
ncbi:MAG: hypothetical protein ACI9VN_003564 [Patescibacteria group bacterium]|jgi:hypothetical protein